MEGGEKMRWQERSNDGSQGQGGGHKPASPSKEPGKGGEPKVTYRPPADETSKTSSEKAEGWRPRGCKFVRLAQTSAGKCAGVH